MTGAGTCSARALSPRLASTLGLLVVLAALLLPAAPAAAAPMPAAGSLAASTIAPIAPDTAEDTQESQRNPSGPGADGARGSDGTGGAGEGNSAVTIDMEGLTDKPSTSVGLLLVLTLLSLLPAILLTCTSFTKILIVLGLTRNALGLQTTPPNQVLAGLALFLSLFIMAPTLSAMNEVGLQPYLDGSKSAAQAYDTGIEPLRGFMLDQTGDEELALLTKVADRDLPESRDDVDITTLVPAFIISELKQAFIIGFIIFIPFLVIDIVVSGALMALGMMMMPPVMVSLPFKLLLFVLVDGWGLIITSLVASYA